MQSRRAFSRGLAGLLVASLPTLAVADVVQVNPQNVSCMVAGKYPQLSASVSPAEGVKKVRLYFRSALSNDFHYVEAASQAGRYVASLPMPRPDAGPITYYFSAISSSGENIAPESKADVVAAAGACSNDRVAATSTTGPATVFTLGGSSAPAGFTGITSLAAGTTVGTAAGGGVSTALLVGGAALVVGGTTALVVTNDDDGPASASR